MPVYDPFTQGNNQRQSAYNTIRGAYRTDLGRQEDQITDDEVWSHLGGGRDYQPSNVDWALSQIRGSDEARAFRERSQKPEATEAPVTGTPIELGDPITASTKPTAPAVPPVAGGAPGSPGEESAPAPAFQPPAPPSLAPPVGAPGAPASPTAPPAPTTPVAPTPPGITDDVTNILRARLKALGQPGDVQSDPTYQNAVKQYQLQALRGSDRQRASLAERMAAGGTLQSGGFNTGVRGIEERQAENEGAFAGNLALDRLQSREQQLMQAISLARSVGQDAIANQLEAQRFSLSQELGRGNLSRTLSQDAILNEMDRERLGLQRELGRGDLALRGELGRGQLGLGYDQLGFSYADLVNRANRDAVLAAL